MFRTPSLETVREPFLILTHSRAAAPRSCPWPAASSHRSRRS